MSKICLNFNTNLKFKAYLGSHTYWSELHPELGLVFRYVAGPDELNIPVLLSASEAFRVAKLAIWTGQVTRDQQEIYDLDHVEILPEAGEPIIDHVVFRNGRWETYLNHLVLHDCRVERVLGSHWLGPFGKPGPAGKLDHVDNTIKDFAKKFLKSGPGIFKNERS